MYLDGGTARTAGETMTINSGGSLTTRTDHRRHANAPASDLGSAGSVTINEGQYNWSSENVRIVAYNSGTGNVPAIGTSVTQGAVSGYFLAAYSSWAAAPTAVGSALPVSGYLKFREITGGAFAPGALTGIGASATETSRQGWISLPFDAAANFTIPRLGKHQARGGRFFLDNTTGVRGQTFQVPSEGSAVMVAPGLMIETSPGSDVYDRVPALNGLSNGWTHVHVGNATGTTDARQKYLKAEAGGILRMGETWSASATYASLAAQAGTYAEVSHACTYTWANNVVEVYFSTGHRLETGQQTGLDFTSGGATAYDGIYTVTVLDPYRFTVPLTGSGTAGNVTSNPGVTVTFTTHTLNIGDSVYCDFTSGTGVDGTYEIYMVGSANAYTLKYPHVTAITSGNVSCLHSLNITSTAHGLAVGQTLYCDFTSGSAADGVYVIRTVPDANTMRISYAHSAAISTSNVTISRDIGYVYPAGCKTWIPSNIVNECATAARATNTIPNATIASRPEWTTTSAGAIDLEYVYCCSGYFNCTQAYSIRLRDCFFFDASIMIETATALDVDGLCMGMSGGLDVVPVTVNNNYAGGLVKNVMSHRGNTPGTSDHCFSASYNVDLTLDNVSGAIIQYARSTGYFYFANNARLTIQDCNARNTRLDINGCPDVIVNNHDKCERINGHGLAALGAVYFNANCHGAIVDGVTHGINFTVDNQHPYVYAYTLGCNNVKVRNIGSFASPIAKPTWAPNIITPLYIFQSGGSNNGVKVQRCYVEAVRTSWFSTTNADKNITYESCYGGMYTWSTKVIFSPAHAELNGKIKGCQEVVSLTGQASVYGTHFIDGFRGTDYGQYLLTCNEPTADTIAQFENVVGAAKFNSSGGVIVQTIGDQCIFTDADFRQGHDGFEKREIVMSGGTITDYNLHYQIDTGSGFSDWKNLYYQRAGASGSSGAYTFTVTDATGVAIGDYCWGTGLSTVGQYTKNALIPRVTNVVGNTITVDIANTATVSGTIRFCHLPDETIIPATGFKCKVRITTLATATAAITFITMFTRTSAASQALVAYPLDTNTLTLTGLKSNSEVRCYTGPPDSSAVEIGGTESSGTSFTFSHSSGSVSGYIQVIAPGYQAFYMPYTYESNDVSLPISQVLDRNYQE